MEQIPDPESTEVPLTSLAELSSTLKPMRMLALEGAIGAKSEFYQEEVRRRGLEDVPTQLVAFTIPLDSYLPLSEAHGVIDIPPDAHESSITLTHNVRLESQIGFQKVTSILTSLVVAIGNEGTAKPLKELDEYTLMAEYRRAIELANRTILAYKLTQGRHNHNLQPVTVTNRPTQIDVFRFDTTIGQILEAGSVHMHQNIWADLHRSDPLSSHEHADFMKYLSIFAVQRDSIAAHILGTINTAIDRVCVGDYTSGLVLADTYTEHFMRYALSRLYVEGGDSEESALGKIDKAGSLDNLLGKLAKALSLTKDDLVGMISFKVWRKACREKRNHITHRFTKTPVEPQEARDALYETIRMNAVLSRIITHRHPNLWQLQLFEAPSWYAGPIKSYDAKDGQALSRVQGIVPYKYS